jgi:hypothetical protein
MHFLPPERIFLVGIMAHHSPARKAVFAGLQPIRLNFPQLNGAGLRFSLPPHDEKDQNSPSLRQKPPSAHILGKATFPL